SYISLFLELVVYLAFVSIFYLKGEGKKAVLINLGMIAGCFVVSILLFQLLFKTIVHEKIISDDGYGTLDERISSIGLSNEGSSGRIRLWNSAIDFIKKNPVLGGGYGNWKINSYNYEKYWQPRWSFGEIHVHNDFLETAADTGIAGGLIYLFIFILVFVYALKLLLTKQVSNEIKMLIMASLLALIAYCVDAFFNFPFEIPNIQILLVFIMAINIHYHIETNQAGVKEKNGNIYSNAIYGIILVSVFSTYISLKVFRSYEVQYKISKEWLGNTEDGESKFTSKEINSQLPTIPNINVATMPMACIKARYLINEKKYDEALSILNADNGSNNLLHYSDYLRSEISLALNQKDSAYYHAKAASLAWPANQQYYKFYSDMVAERKDTVELEKAFNEMSKLNPIPLFYLDYSQNYFLCTGNQEKRIAIIEDGLKKFPKNKKLNFQKSFLKALNEYKNKNYRSAIVEYQNALTFQADDKISKQTIAYSYCNLKEFDKALPYFTELIDGKAFSNGEMEFYRGICYINLNEQAKACLDFKAAINKGYPVNPDLVKTCK
ncbi:MAG: O-antigen ligase family protein, partial [Bacteroidota bacterium]